MTRRLVLLATLGAALAAAPAAEAANFVVNDAGDAGDANPGNGACATGGGVCTLRAAIQEANANADPDDGITFAPGVTQIDVATTLNVGAAPCAGACRVQVTGPVMLAGVGGVGTILQLSSGAAGSTFSQLTIRGAGGAGIDLGGTVSTVSRSPIFGNATPIAGSPVSAPSDLRIGPRRADGTLPLTGSTNGGLLELYRGNAFASSPIVFDGELSLGPGPFSFVFPSEPAPGSVYSATMTTGGGTSAFATATVPDDVASPEVVGAVAISTTQVRVILSEPVDPGSIGIEDFGLEMAEASRTVTGISLDPTGTQVFLTSSGWENGEAGFLNVAGPGAFTDVAGNATLAAQRLRVAAAPGDFLGPVASSLSVRPRAICLTRSRLCRRTGATVRFISNEEGRARLVVLRGNRRVGEDVANATAGRNAIRFNGRLRGRKLRAGSYRMLLYVEDRVGNVTEEPPIQRFTVRRSTR